MNLGCCECALHIGNLEERVVCDGCYKKYHLSCAKMNPYQLRVCLEFDNVLWLCNKCLSSFREQQSASSKTDLIVQGKVNDNKTNDNEIDLVVQELQAEISSIKESFDKLQRTFNSGCQWISDNTVLPSTSTPQGNINRNNSFNDTSQLMVGSNAERVSTSPRTFWIFFTRVAKHVSSDTMRQMVSNSLQLEDQPQIVRLVPHWINNESLRYVSYKIGVNWKYREKALLASTWPVGLQFRQFVHHEFNYWEP